MERRAFGVQSIICIHCKKKNNSVFKCRVISRVPSLAGNVVARSRIRGSGRVVGKQEVRAEQRVVQEGKSPSSATDIFSLLPAQFVTADMVPDSVGMWMFHCHVDEQMEAGMTAMYEVLP
jgi:hypothetical protein